MGVEGSSGGGRRRERLTSEPRGRRVNLSFNDAELEVVRLAAGREGMSPASWAGRQVMAVAQHVLVPVSRDAGDVLRELIAARVHLRETVTALRALAAVGPPADGGPATAADGVARALDAVAQVDEATLQVMRERRPRS
ncbi:hypothetical protein GT352_11490 [Streptomyces sp. SID1046]|nr:hypothetical protein [Streptomyces sp. SID1046]MYV74554.1 hypothetical protein [Streptomyces sp. SID1046]